MTFLKSVQRTFSVNTDRLLLICLIGFVFASIGYAVFSYGLTAPNLVLSTWEPFWEFQTSMWKTLFNNRQNLGWSFAGLLAVFFAAYLGLLHILSKAETELIPSGSLLAKLKSASSTTLLFAYLALISPLFFASNALSYDVFNYIFNAKMVVVYQVNPHVQTALEFADDPWVRFMHNVHTPAPYWYGWTALSLVPYTLGFGKLLTTWLSFRLFSVLSVVSTLLAVRFFAQAIGRKLSLFDYALVFLNPLFLLEIVGNSHNDLWMLAPAIAALALLLQHPEKNLTARTVLLSVALLAASASIKIATVALIPILTIVILLRLYGQRTVHTLKKRFRLPEVLSEKVLAVLLQRVALLVPFLASVVLFLPLFTVRSQQYLPWYLTWALIWLPLAPQKMWRDCLIVASAAALCRYIPWMLAGEYTSEVLSQQKLITWAPLAAYFLVALLRFRRYNTT